MDERVAVIIMRKTRIEWVRVGGLTAQWVSFVAVPVYEEWENGKVTRFMNPSIEDHIDNTPARSSVHVQNGRNTCTKLR
jgi:hypothetical protein